jgi:hypothetical protein
MPVSELKQLRARARDFERSLRKMALEAEIREEAMKTTL